MKKIVAIMMALLMCLALVACGEPAESGDTTAPEDGGTQAPEDSGEVDGAVERQVTEEQWNAALDSQKFYNVTVEFGEIYGEDNFSVTIAYDGKWNMTYSTRDSITMCDISLNDGDMDSAEIASVCAAGHGHFAEFTYDGAKGEYTGYVPDPYSEDGKFMVVYRFADGVLEACRVYEDLDDNGRPESEDEYTFLNFSKFGTTEVDDPEDNVTAAISAALSDGLLGSATVWMNVEDCSCDLDLTACECGRLGQAVCVCRYEVEKSAAKSIISVYDLAKLDNAVFADGVLRAVRFDHGYQEGDTFYSGLNVIFNFDEQGRIVYYENSLGEQDTVYTVVYAD